MTKKKPQPCKKKGGIFRSCLSCFGLEPIKCDEVMCALGKDYTEQEYVIENLAIRKAPVKILETCVCPKKKKKKKKRNKKHAEKISSGYMVKKVLPEICIGPVGEIGDTVNEGTSCPFVTVSRPTPTMKNISCGPTIPNLKHHDCPLSRPPNKRHCILCKAFYAETTPDLDDDMMQQILNSRTTLYDDVKSQKLEVFADIHRADDDIINPIQLIPAEIKQTIEALKMARPLHHTSDFSTRKHRTVIASLSTTSLDKEIICNFEDIDRNFIKETREEWRGSTKDTEKLSRVAATSPSKCHFMKPASSTSDTTPHPPDIVESDAKESTDLQSTEKSIITETSAKGQSLKWKIIINKHKKDKNKNSK